MKRFALAAALSVLASPPAAAAGRQVTFSAMDGTPLVATLYDAAPRPAPGVVLVHMLGRSRDDWNGLADRLEEAGMVVLAIDLRGHGRSGGSAAALPSMVDDVRAAIAWIVDRPGLRHGALAIVGASLGANLALVAAADSAAVRAVAALSPSLDYRGIRLDTGVMRKLAERPLWFAASTQDPYALRTIRELASTPGPREQRLSGTLAHGTNLLTADPEIGRSLVDWLRRTLIY